jgi:hypothetical protein
VRLEDKRLSRTTLLYPAAKRSGTKSDKAPYRLVEEIVALSVANTWHLAKSEWALAEVYLADQPGTCLCGHYPIIEHCVLCNRENGNTAVVGNVCVTRFLGLASEVIFAGLRRITHDCGKAMNQAAIEYAHSRGWINDWERDFYLDTSRKGKLSPKQRAKRVEINRRVLAQATRPAPEVEGRRDA